MSAKIVLFELNETPWRVILDHVERQSTGALATMLRRGASYETIARDRTLTPWSTWSTVHRGVDDATHGITDRDQHLGEHDRVHPPLWSLLRREGLQVGVFGALHSHPAPTERTGVAFHVPHPSPTEASSAMVPRSLGALAGRLFEWGRARPAPAIDGFDTFMRLLGDRRPDFATFFTDHVASAMHRFWAAAYPGDFTQHPEDDAWRRLHRDAIAGSMATVDAMLARLLQWSEADADREVWITTSMGQAATHTGQRARTQVQLVHVDGFMAHLGFGTRDFVREYATAPRVVLNLDAAKAEAFVHRAREVEIAPGKHLGVEALGGGRYHVVVPVLRDHGDGPAVVRGETVSLRSLGFCHAPIAEGEARTADHVPEGVMMVHRHGAAGGVAGPRRRISTVDVAPMLLHRLGVAPPAYMRTDAIRRGVGQPLGRQAVSPAVSPAANVPPWRSVADGARSS